MASTRRVALAILLTGWWLGWAGWALASSTARISLPIGTPRSASAFSLLIESDWVQGNGHRPIFVVFHSGKALAEDLSVVVELSVDDYLGPYITVATELLLPAGQQTATAWVPVPQLQTSQNLRVRTVIGGREIESLSMEQIPLQHGQAWTNDTGVPRILFISDSPPDVSKFQFLGGAHYNPYGSTQSFTRVRDFYAFVHRQRVELYDEPLFYSGLDFIFVSLGEARRIATEQPEVWQAMCHWARAGGVLLVYGARQSDDRLAEIESLVELPAEDSPAAPHRGWRTPTKIELEKAVLEQVTLGSNIVQVAPGQPQQQVPGQPNPGVQVPQMPADPPFFIRDMGFGHVVAWAEPKPFPGEEHHWQWLLGALPQTSSHWTDRHGVAPGGENPQFNEFLIADVGLPPIRTYRVLITAFVVLIGPLNYWILRRAGRLYLFLFTVPLAALVTSGGLLGYALLSDGLEARMRAMSLTLLDQRVGQAASSARLSYYMGLAPADGLRFPRDLLVIPMELNSRGFRGYGQDGRQMRWAAEQDLVRGWLNSRTPTQLVTETAYTSQSGLDFGPRGADGARGVTNRLGAAIHRLLVCDEDGNLLIAAKLDEQQSGVLEPVAAGDPGTETVARFLKAYSAHAPALPEGMTAFDTNDGWFWFGRRNYIYGSAGNVDARSNQLDEGLARVRADIAAHTLPKRSYVALVDRPPQINGGTDGLIETQSTHVIFGRW